jgi:hypothetical protein
MKKNKFVSFVSDEHLILCIENLNKAYLKAKKAITKKSLFSNKVDTIKLTITPFNK